MKYTKQQQEQIKKKPIVKDGFLIIESKINCKFGNEIKSQKYDDAFFEKLFPSRS